MLRGATGADADGAVAVYAVHADDDGLAFEPLTTVPVSGSFVIRLVGSAGIRAQAIADANDGYVNIAVPAVTDQGRTITFGTLEDPGSHADAANALRVKLMANHPRLHGDSALLRRIRKTGGASPAGYHPTWCNYQVSGTSNEDTSVGEMHVIAGVTETFKYAQGNVADTDVSVAVNIAGGAGGYQLDGTYHVSNSDQVVIGRTRSGAYGKVLKSEFHYVRYHKPGTAYPLDCLAADDDYIIATRWNGGWAEGSDVSSLDNRCGALHHSNYYQGDDFYRDQNDLRTWSGAATVFGVGFTAKSGASSRVTISYTFGGASGSHCWLCGSDGYPGSAHRIYVDKV